MIFLRHRLGSPFVGGYSSDHVGPWPVGEERLVEPPVASYLVGTFPTAFELVGEVPPSPVVDLDPPAADPDAQDLEAALQLAAPALVAAIRSGLYDQHLGALADLEGDAKARTTVLAAIGDRQSRTSRAEE